MLGAAQSLQSAIGSRRSAIDQAAVDDLAAAARVVLGESAFAGAWEESSAMVLERVIALAMPIAACREAYAW